MRKPSEAASCFFPIRNQDQRGRSADLGTHSTGTTTALTQVPLTAQHHTDIPLLSRAFDRHIIATTNWKGHQSHIMMTKDGKGTRCHCTIYEVVVRFITGRSLGVISDPNPSR